jgi:outer membrane protein OmpA-like peptidoglycan-associated protein
MTITIWNVCTRSIGVICLIGMLSSARPMWGQFTVERSPWLDGPEITDEPIDQRWAVANQKTNEPLHVELIVEGINPRKTVRLDVDSTMMLSLQPFRRYTRICVEPEFMLHTDRIWADPKTLCDTLRLRPLEIGLEVDLEPIEFTPGASQLYHTSIPTLEALYTFLVINPTVGIAVVGHEQPAPTPSETAFESRERARAVWEYLVTNGVDPNRLAVEGEGSQRMRFPEPKTVEEAEANRRVTVRVTHY